MRALIVFKVYIFLLLDLGLITITLMVYNKSGSYNKFIHKYTLNIIKFEEGIMGFMLHLHWSFTEFTEQFYKSFGLVFLIVGLYKNNIQSSKWLVAIGAFDSSLDIYLYCSSLDLCFAWDQRFIGHWIESGLLISDCIKTW